MTTLKHNETKAIGGDVGRFEADLGGFEVAYGWLVSDSGSTALLVTSEANTELEKLVNRLVQALGRPSLSKGRM